MVPVPNVGEGAPYRSAQELARVADAARLERMESQALALQFLTCRMMANPPQRLSFSYPSEEELLNREGDAANRAAIEAGRAGKATEAAEQARRDAASGKADMKAVEAAELARQAAVNKAEEVRIKFLEAGAAIADFQDLQRRGWVVVNMAGDPEAAQPRGNVIQWSDLDAKARKRREAGWWIGVPAPDPGNGLTVSGVEAHENTVKGKSIVTITGQIRNPTDKELPIPDLAVTAIDSKGFILTGVPIATGAKVPAKAARAFAYDLKPAPDAVSKIAVTFSSQIGPPPRMRIAKPDC